MFLSNNVFNSGIRSAQAMLKIAATDHKIVFSISVKIIFVLLELPFTELNIQYTAVNSAETVDMRK